jgi:amino acid adenylation domain-containing protein
VSEVEAYATSPVLLQKVEQRAIGISLLPASELEVEASIAQRFEAQVRLHGERLALQTGAQTLTYGDLNARANRQAHALLALQRPASEPIALLLDQGPAYISALLGVLKAGHCYVPLDPANPSVRNEQMLEDCGAHCIVTNGANLPLSRAMSAGRCEVLDVDSLTTRAATHNPNIVISPDDLAYVLYTSGSTGRPKGVMVDHRTALHNMQRHAQAFRITPEDRQTLLYTCSVYGGTRDIFNALLNGASLHTFPVKQQGVAGLGRWLQDSGITIYCSVATVFRQFVATLGESERFPRLRLIKLGGEASHRKDIDLFRAHFSPSCVLHCGLGSTETGVVRHFFVDHHTRLEGAAVPLGFPIDGVQVELLGENGKPVTAGEVGEIVIRSRYIARGYWRRPELNATVFAPDPEDSEARVYRTGDLGVMRADGCLEHRGRKDFQVKVRGNRIELAEIENTLCDVEGVAHAAVVTKRDQREQNYLVAYVVFRGGEKLTVSALRAALAIRLPDYMIPSVFMTMDALPQTPNGKIDRQALPEPHSTRPDLAQAYLAPRTPTESTLASLWAELLSVDSVGVHDNFFDLGGHSLIAVTMMARIRQRFDFVLPLAILFKAGNIEKLAEVVDRRESKPWSPLVSIRTGGARAPLFCIHPGGGNVLGYNEFIEKLDADLPVYGLQAYGVVEGQEPHDSIPQMARIYLQSVREVQPHGPYYLGGESFGGLVAYEMACQLQEAGERVALLFLGDVWMSSAQVQKSLRYKLSRFTYLFTLSFADWRDLFERKILKRGARQFVTTKRYTYADDMHRRNSQAHRKASREFLPRSYAGKVTLFRALDQHHGIRKLQHYYGEAAMNWNRTAAGGTEVHWMPGWHGNMMHDAQALGFARKLQECIDRAARSESL